MSSQARQNTAITTLIVGAVAFGIWQHSVAAGIFMAVLPALIQACALEVAGK